MRKLLVVSLFSLVAAPFANAEVKWNAQGGMRHVITTADDGLNSIDNTTNNKDTSKTTTKQYQFRYFLGASGMGENVDWGIDLRTTGSTTSEWVTTLNNADYAQTIGQAYGRWHTHAYDSDLAVTVGRQRSIILTDNLSEVLFDNDVRWDGFSENWAMNMFGLNLTQYVLGSTNRGTGGSSSTYNKTDSSDSNPDTQSHFAALLAFQPYVKVKINEDISGKFAIGYLNWSGTGASSTGNFYTNAVHGGTAGTVGNTTAVSLDDSRQLQLFTDWSLPMDFRFVGEYIWNKKRLYGRAGSAANPETVEAQRKALSLSLGWGKSKKAGDFWFQYSYSNKGIASVVNTFTNGDAPADEISHLFFGKYMITDQWSFAAKAQWHNEKADLGGDGQPVAAPNNSRHQKRNRFELVTAIAI